MYPEVINMKRLKILMLTSSYPRPFIKSIAAGLVKKKIDVTIMVYSTSRKFKKYNESGIHIIEYPYSLFLPPMLHKYNGLIPSVKKSLFAKIEFPMYLISTLFFLNKFSKDCDIIHAHWFFPSGFIAAINKIFVKKPLITTAWGAEFHLPKNFIVKKMLKYVNKKSDVKVAISKYMKTKAKEYGLNTKDMIVIPNTVDIEKFSLKRKKGRKIIIATIRRLVPEKRTEDLINAVGLLPEDLKKRISLWIIGDGPEKEKLMELTKDLNLDDITKFWGMVPHKKIPDLLSRADIFANTTVQEGMATVNLEAMAAGTCVIATRGFGNDEVITDKKNGFLYKPKNIKSLSKKINSLILNKQLRIRVGKVAPTIIKKKFPSEKIVQLYLEEYEKLLK